MTIGVRDELRSFLSHTNIHSMAGGWTAWQEAGAPTEAE